MKYYMMTALVGSALALSACGKQEEKVEKELHEIEQAFEAGEENVETGVKITEPAQEEDKADEAEKETADDKAESDEHTS